ncbi:MAG: 2'-5' RNA ligase family protein, partial [Micrococcales bacterium]|nr:2'-5' RNA ligase family protein [Micrococcales bacterium]
MRLFAAVWPPDEVLDHLDLALGAVRRTLPGDGTGPLRWSARETWHLTCAFYGVVPDGLVPGIAAELAAATAGTAPYQLRLRGAGIFSHRTLWVGVGGDTAAQQGVARAAIDAGPAVGAR